MDNNIFCTLCKVFIPGKTHLRSHFFGKKHQTVLQAQNKQDNEFYITKLPDDETKEEILLFFYPYGDIEQMFFATKNEFVIILFKQPVELLKSSVVFKEQPLEIKRMYDMVPKSEPANKKPTTTKIKEKTSPINTNITDASVFKHVSAGIDLNHQLKILIHHLQPNWDLFMNARNRLCLDLEWALHRIFTDASLCTVHPFGSTMTALAFKDSDVDIYVELISKNGFRNVDPMCVKRCKNISHKTRGLFTHAFCIPKAKTPIIKCVHAPTNLSCDLNFKNLLGVCNTRLINYYLSLNVRLQSIMVLIKYWGKTYELTGSGKLSNYALIMLFITYLQQAPYSLPTVSHLQEIPPALANLQDGWNGGFSCPSVVCDELKTTPTADILTGFFRFCARLDYNLHVVCPYLGMIMLRSYFLNVDDVPNEFKLYQANVATEGKPPLRINTFMCIQDPFELNHNVANSVCSRLLQSFRAHCHVAVDILKSSKEKDIIPNLLKKQDTVQSLIKKETDKFTIPLGNSYMYLEQLDSTNVKCGALNKLQQLQQVFYDAVDDFLLVVLNDILHCSVSSESMDDPSGIQKQRDVDVVSSHSYLCKGRYNTWIARNYLSKNITISGPSTTLETEVALSLYAVNVMQDVIKSNDFIVDFNVKVQNKENPTRVSFIFTNRHCNTNDFATMMQFLAKKLQSGFEKHVSEERHSDKNSVKDAENDENEETVHNENEGKKSTRNFYCC